MSVLCVISNRSLRDATIPSHPGAGLIHYNKIINVLSMALLCILFVYTDAHSQSISVSASGNSGVLGRATLSVNKSKNIKISVPFSDVSVGASDIADVIPISDRQLNVIGKKVGSTNILLYDNNKQLIGTIDILVNADNQALAEKLRYAAAAPGIQVRDVEGKVVLHGGNLDSPTVNRVMNAAPSGAINALGTRTNQQVMVQVRFVEVNRSAIRALGIRWQGIVNNRMAGSVGTTGASSALGAAGLNPGAATRAGGPIVPGAAASGVVANALGLVSRVSPTATILAQLVNTGSASLDVVVSALEEQGVVRRLAEPNLVALSGEEAMFLAGGEFPIPVAQPGGAGAVPVITVQWKEYGVRLHFVPTVLSSDIISMRIEPEVSDLDYVNSVEISGIKVPAILSRRTRTTVELREGQAFAISGLIQTKDTRTLDQVPWLGSVPVLGSLFRSTEFQKDETELVALITPYLVKPVPPGNKDPRLKTPFDNALVGNDLDTVIGGKLEVQKSQPTYVSPTGAEQVVAGGMAPGAPVINSEPEQVASPDPISSSLRSFFGGFGSSTPPQ